MKGEETWTLPFIGWCTPTWQQMQMKQKMPQPQGAAAPDGAKTQENEHHQGG